MNLRKFGSRRIKDNDEFIGSELKDYIWSAKKLSTKQLANYFMEAMTSSGVDDATYVNVCKKVLGWLKDWNQKYNKVSDSRRVADYRGQYIGESQYKDKYIELADMLYRMIPDGLTYQEASEILEDEGLVLVEYGGGFGGKYPSYAVYAYEDDERFGDYGNSDAGVWLDYESDGEMYVTDAYKVG